MLYTFSLGKILQYVFLACVSCFLIFSPSLNLVAYDGKRIMELCLIALALLFSLFGNTWQNKNQPFFNLAVQHKAALTAIIILLIASSLNALDQISAFLEVSLYLGLLFFCFQIGRITSDTTQIFHLFIFSTFALIALFYQANFFTAFLASFIENIPLQWPEPFSGFSNVRFFNQFQICSIALLPLPLLIYLSLDKRLLNFLKLIAIGWALLLFASGSRGAVASLIISMILTLIVFRKHAMPLLKLNSSQLLAGAIGYLLLFKLVPYILENNVTQGWRPVASLTQTNDRLALWRYAINYVIEHPWLGIGPMHYAYYPGPTHAHPHNSILQWASEMGIPSTLLVIYLTISGLIAWVKKFYRLQNENKLYVPVHLWIALFCSVSSGLIYSLVSGVIVMPLSQLMMVLIIGWMTGLYFYDTESKPIGRIQRISVMLLAGATLITMTYTVLPSLLPRLISYADLPYQNYPITAPRFWQIGGIPH